MTTHPTTFRGESGDGSHWDDQAELHRRDDEGGVFHQFKTIRRGSFSDLIAFVLRLPEDEQADYAIQKSGDHRLEIGEIRALGARADFPGRRVS